MAGRGLRKPQPGMIAGQPGAKRVLESARKPRGSGCDAARIPLSLYVHIPWCVRKCPYCDFNSHAQHGPLDEGRYVQALLADLDHELRRAPLPEVQSVFIGGGTPSLFSGSAVGRLLDGIARRLDLAEDAEITLEANPGTAEADRFADYRAAGVNRLSLGVQSLDDACLVALGRIHSADEAVAAYRLARSVGFDNVNLDLMYGLPGQDTAGALRDLESLIGLDPDHVSWYQLTLEPNTLFYQRPPVLPDDDSLADMMEAGQSMLADAAFRQYEISAYAGVGRQARHNLNYWQFGDYLGIGAGAHGKLTSTRCQVHRTIKRRHPLAYFDDIARGAVQSEYRVAEDELPVEFFLNALRLTEGVSAASFVQRTGLPLTKIASPLDQARARGLLESDPAHFVPTELGQRYLNDLLALFDSG
jgi:putative oxygen-independent coproporphyrinogen III oxidase